MKYEKIAKWIKSVFNYYYFDSYIENNQKKQNENLIIYSKKDFENETMKYFNLKPEETVDDLIEISDDEKFPEIIRDLLNIQLVVKRKNLNYNFNFQNFVINFLKIEIDENNLLYLNIQIQIIKKMKIRRNQII